MAEEEAELEDQQSDMDEGPESSRTLVDIPVIPFEPPATGDGHDIATKLGKVKTAIQSKVTPDEIAKFKESLKGRLMSITLAFFLWKGSTRTTNTRPVKDLDNLMKIMFDVLGKSPPGLGLLEEDSYVCEVYAKKELVDDESDEGLRIIIEEYQDEPMLGTLTQYYTKKAKAATS
ncbi:MAG TPA: hypothetical protein VFE98_01250 [Candidatus Bathyarchaeia archaeon]|nr:hypothetical protein [Candidatus Bathyarchaeia archaeon]